MIDEEWEICNICAKKVWTRAGEERGIHRATTASLQYAEIGARSEQSAYQMLYNPQQYTLHDEAM